MRISDWSSDVCSSDLCKTYPAPGRKHPVSTYLRPHEILGQGHPRYPLRVVPASRWRLCAIARDRFRGLVQLVRRILSRSEEHTSELQSLMRISYAVFCLKKQTKIPR